MAGLKAIGLAFLLTLALTAPSAARPAITYDAAAATYTFTGTGQTDRLQVEPAKGGTGLVFTSLLDNPSLDVGPEALCRSLGERRKQCDAPADLIVFVGEGESDDLGVPAEEVTTLAVPLRLEGGPGFDDLWGGRGADVLIGGPRTDGFSPGLGADALEDEAPIYVEHLYDGRTEGIELDLTGTKSAGADPGDTYGDVRGVGGTRFDDTIALDSPDSFAFGAAGDDFIDLRGAEDGGLDCGAGDDVAATNGTIRPEECEHAGPSRDPQTWSAGFLAVESILAGFTEGFSDAEGSIVLDAGFDAQCLAPKPGACALRFKVRFPASNLTFSMTDAKYERGAFAVFEFELTDAQYSLLRKEGKQEAIVTARLTNDELRTVKLREVLTLNARKLDDF